MAAELPCARRTKHFLEENGDRVLRKENKKNGIRTPVVRKEDKKGGNEPQVKPPSSIFSPIRSVCIGMIGSLNVTDLKFGLHIYDLNLPIEAKLFSRSSAI